MGKFWRSIILVTTLVLVSLSLSRAGNDPAFKEEPPIDWNFALSGSALACFPAGDYYQGVSWGKGFELAARVRVKSNFSLGFAYARPSLEIEGFTLYGPGFEVLHIPADRTSLETNRYTFFGEIHRLMSPKDDSPIRSYYIRLGFSVIDQELTAELTPEDQAQFGIPVDELIGPETDYGIDLGAGILLPFGKLGYFDINGTIRTVFFNNESENSDWDQQSFMDKVGTALNFDISAGIIIKI